MDVISVVIALNSQREESERDRGQGESFPMSPRKSRRLAQNEPSVPRTFGIARDRFSLMRFDELKKLSGTDMLIRVDLTAGTSVLVENVVVGAPARAVKRIQFVRRIYKLFSELARSTFFYFYLMLELLG